MVSNAMAMAANAFFVLRNVRLSTPCFSASAAQENNAFALPLPNNDAWMSATLTSDADACNFRMHARSSSPKGSGMYCVGIYAPELHKVSCCFVKAWATTKPCFATGAAASSR